MVSFTVIYTLTIDKLNGSYHVTRKNNSIIEKSDIEELEEEIKKLR